ncbi:MAG: DHH family phosphoesterase [Sciscionella sp.]
MTGHAAGDPAKDITAEDAAKVLAEASEVALFAHVAPDADALGSALAVASALRQRGKRVWVAFGEPAETPESLRHLDPLHLVVPVDAVPAAPELIVALDTASAARLGILAGRVSASIAAGGTVLVLDHHVSNTRFGTHNHIDPTAEATATIAARVLEAMGVALTDPGGEPIARGLYAGLATDTSMFRRATPDTHRLAARLLEAGVDADATLRPITDVHPFGWLRMLSAVLAGARLEPDAARGLGLVSAVVTAEDAAGLRSEEVESVVDVVRATGEAEVAAVLKQAGPSTWTGSLRAVGALDVSAVARHFGGGGHTLAAGFTAHGSAREVLDELRSALESAPLR